MQNSAALALAPTLLTVVTLAANPNPVVLTLPPVRPIAPDRAAKKSRIDPNPPPNLGTSPFLIMFVVTEQETTNLNGLVMILVVVLVHVLPSTPLIRDRKQSSPLEKLPANRSLNVSSPLEVPPKSRESISRDPRVLPSPATLLLSIPTRTLPRVDVPPLPHLLNSKTHVVSNRAVILYYLHIARAVLKHPLRSLTSKAPTLLIKMEVVREHLRPK